MNFCNKTVADNFTYLATFAYTIAISYSSTSQRLTNISNPLATALGASACADM